MKEYIGIKCISAEPQIEGGFSKVGTHDGIITRDGYKVIYDNDYVSWSPKDVFEKAYIEVKPFELDTTKEYQPHQERVIQEYNELQEKHIALNKFLDSEFFKTINEDEQKRLMLQHKIMLSYLLILAERITNF